MKVIWKFLLNPGLGGHCTVSMPRVREHLSVGMQANAIVMWAAVDPSQETEDVRFAIAGTGWDMPEGIYRGTVQAGDFVWHIVELQEGKPS